MKKSKSKDTQYDSKVLRFALALPMALALVFYVHLVNVLRGSPGGNEMPPCSLEEETRVFPDTPSKTKHHKFPPTTLFLASLHGSSSAESSVSSTQQARPTNLGRRIVENAFNQSYVDLVQFCNKSGSTARELKRCIYHFFLVTKNKEMPFAKKWPWWFQTMMRDAAKDPELYSPWHEVQFQDPNLQLCVIEKVGSKQFYQFHCNAQNITKAKHGKQCYKYQGPLIEDSDRSVFLRDPLERFLSGFINKCIERRHDQEHCQPRSVFENPDTTLVGDFYENHQKLFEAYVDAMPLTWDLHYIPQSLYCGGLYNSIQNYAFVGNMGDNFYRDLDRFGKQYPRLDPYLRDQFRIKERQGNSKLLEYYTPTTVYKVLEYHSIDYVLLNLQIPEWAETMLLEHPILKA